MSTIIEEINRQSQDLSPENFRCDKCKNYEGKLVCLKGVFIAFEGANLSVCMFFRPGQKCPHCGERF